MNYHNITNFLYYFIHEQKNDNEKRYIKMEKSYDAQQKELRKLQVLCDLTLEISHNYHLSNFHVSI